MQSLSNKKLFPSASNDKFTNIGSVVSMKSSRSPNVKLPTVVKGARLRQAQKDIYNAEN